MVDVSTADGPDGEHSNASGPQGHLFYGAEDVPEVLFLMKSGKVELYRESPDGKKLTLAIVEQGSFFGEMSLVGQRLLGTCALTLGDSVNLSAQPARRRGAHPGASQRGLPHHRGAGR